MSNHYKIVGCVRPGSEFRFEKKPENAAQATFIIINDNGDLYVTRYVTELINLREDLPVIANWHGARRTDSFSTTVGELKEKMMDYNKQNYT